MKNMLNFKKFQRWLILPLDLSIVCVSYYLSWVLKFDSFYPTQWQNFIGWNSYLIILLFHVICASIIFSLLGIYKSLWRYASVYDITQIAKATALTTFFTLTTTWLYNRLNGFPRSSLILENILIFLFLSIRSFSWRIFREFNFILLEKRKKINTLIIGSKSTAFNLIRELVSSEINYKVITILDVTAEEINTYIQGLPIFNKLEELPKIIKEYSINQVIISETLDGSKIRYIYRNCERLNVNCKTLPPIIDSLKVTGDIASNLRSLQLEDLLSREEVQLKTTEIEEMIYGKVILVTGAGGSIGSELCRQLINYKPTAIVLVDISENSLYEIDLDLRSLLNSTYKPIIIPIIGGVQDEVVLKKIFDDKEIHLVFHCAAYKHVPLMEYNVEQALNNNILGTIRLAQAARSHGVERFLMLSTDKAVNPVNIMGASKRISELYLQNLSRVSDTKFINVRFGNVLGSQGSVVPLFKKQIAAGGPVTITHPEITRFFMTIPEAVGLVIQAGVMGKGGEVFILDMGEPIKIKELAEDMIRFSGLVPHKDIMLEYTGLRPGEKLFEELLNIDEYKEKTNHRKIQIAMSNNINLDILASKINSLLENLENLNRLQLDDYIRNIIPEYRPVKNNKLV